MKREQGGSTLRRLWGITVRVHRGRSAHSCTQHVGTGAAPGPLQIAVMSRNYNLDLLTLNIISFIAYLILQSFFAL